MPDTLRPESIEDLKAIWKKNYGEDLPDAAAWEIGNRLVRLFVVLARIGARSREVRTASRLTDRTRPR
jgi:hypothetical protein